MKQRIVTLIIFFSIMSILWPHQSIVAEKPMIDTDSFVKSIEIINVDFPKTLQTWKSTFDLDITVHKNGIFPMLCNVIVLLKNQEKMINIPRIIGAKIIPLYETNNTTSFSIPCNTYFNIIKNKIKQNYLWGDKNYKEFIIKTDELFFDGELTVIIFGGFKGDCKREKVQLVQPLTCHETIEINNFNMDSETDENGTFSVSFNLTNKIEYDLNVSILVDIADRPIFNGILPPFLKMSSTLYNVGFKDVLIAEKKEIYCIINCSFPENWYCHEEFDVTVEFAPYIDVGDSSIFLGEEFYDARFKDEILPKYDVNATVLKSIKCLWYNTPFFLDPSESLFPAERGVINFNKTSYLDESIKKVNETARTYFQKIENYVYYFIILVVIFLIVFPIYRGVIDWIVRKKS